MGKRRRKKEEKTQFRHHDDDVPIISFYMLRLRAAYTFWQTHSHFVDVQWIWFHFQFSRNANIDNDSVCYSISSVFFSYLAFQAPFSLSVTLYLILYLTFESISFKLKKNEKIFWTWHWKQRAWKAITKTYPRIWYITYINWIIQVGLFEGDIKNNQFLVFIWNVLVEMINFALCKLV